jgi:DNA polymerase
MKIHIDFETYSELSVTQVGSWAYSKHPSTDGLCMSWRTDDDHGFWINENRPGPIIDPATKEPKLNLRVLFNRASLLRLFNLIEDRRNTVHAHNVFFEKCIWWHIFQVKHGWPAIDIKQWRCTAAKAAACAIPRALEDAGPALRLPIIKDSEGHKVMLKLTRKGKGTFEEWETLYKYCEQDTLAEQCLDEALPDLPPKELRVWQVDQDMNARGIPVDVEGAKKAIHMIKNWTGQLNEEISTLTNGNVTAATQRDRLKAWMEDYQGIRLANTKAENLDYLLSINYFDKRPKAKRAVEILRSLGKSSTAKYETIVERAHDGVLHDTSMYHGGTTGRFTAKGFQHQNLVRGGLKDMELAWATIHKHYDDPETIELFYGDVMKFLSHAVRGVIRAEDGTKLYCGDFSAVETCVIFWLAGEERGLEILRNPLLDIYLDMASDIYGRLITKEDAKSKEGDDARQLGKRAILGLGFGMGFIKYLMTCHTYKMYFDKKLIDSILSQEEQLRISKDLTGEFWWPRIEAMGFGMDDLPELTFSKFIVDRYRTKYQAVVQLWEDTEDAMKEAIRQPEKVFSAGKCKWKYSKNFKHGIEFLMCQLPSTRVLYYPFPLLTRDGVTFMGVDGETHQWRREGIYGGKAVENETQAVARDALVDSMDRTDRHAYYDLRMTVHDELAAQSARGDVKEFNELISVVPSWAPGLPLAAKSWAGVRYRK